MEKTKTIKNIHRLPSCELCGGPMRLGKAMSGLKIYCKEYHTCGGIIHNIQPQSASAISGGVNAGEGTLSLDSRYVSKKVDTPQVSLSSPGGPSPGSANYRRMQQYA